MANLSLHPPRYVRYPESGNLEEWGGQNSGCGAGELTVSRALGDFQLADLKSRAPEGGGFEGPLIANPEVCPFCGGWSMTRASLL